MCETEEAHTLTGSGHRGMPVPVHCSGKGAPWTRGGRGWEFGGAKKLLSPSSRFDAWSTYHAYIRADEGDEGEGSILLHPACQSGEISYWVWAVKWNFRFSGYALGNAACNDAFWCTLWLVGHLFTVCDIGSLSWFSWRFFLSYKSQEGSPWLHFPSVP